MIVASVFHSLFSKCCFKVMLPNLTHSPKLNVLPLGKNANSHPYRKYCNVFGYCWLVSQLLLHKRL